MSINFDKIKIPYDIDTYGSTFDSLKMLLEDSGYEISPIGPADECLWSIREDDTGIINRTLGIKNPTTRGYISSKKDKDEKRYLVVDFEYDTKGAKKIIKEKFNISE